MSVGKKILIQRVTALERLAEIGIVERREKVPTMKEVKAWAQELRDAIKLMK
jgi:hypothetical protein